MNKMESRISAKGKFKKELAALRVKLAEREIFRIQKEWIYGRIKAERTKLDYIVNALPNGINIISSDYKILFQNKWLQRRFGNSLGKLCYKDCMKRKTICPGCPVRVAIRNNKAADSKLLELNGLYYELSAVPIGKFDGKISAMEIITDITRQKNAERGILKEQQKYFDLVNNLSVGVYRNTPGPNGHFLEANPAMIFMFEAESKEQFMKHKVSDLYLDFKKRKKTSDKLSALGFIRNEELELITLRGKKFWGSVTATKKKDKQGNVYFDGIVEDITERKQYEEKLHNLTLVDELTGLYNRRGFFKLAEHQLKISQRYAKGISLFFIDLDNMKWINDTMGHAAGDKALVDFASILRRTCRGSDIVARIGGDEFVVLAIGLEKENYSCFTIRLQENINVYNLDASCSCKLSISIGFASSSFMGPCSIHELLNQADKSMYGQKQNKEQFKLPSYPTYAGSLKFSH